MVKKRKELIKEDPKSDEIIRPILRGRDIKRYGYDWKDLWLINTHNGTKTQKRIDINNYPAIKKHLDQYYDQLVARTDQGDTPYNLRDCAYMNDFSKQKIMYSEIVQSPQFYLDNEGKFYAEATSFIMTGTNLEYLLLSLNSKLFEFAFKKFYSGGGLGEKGYRYKKAFLENLPILIPTKKIDRDFIKTLKSDEEADRFIYSLYNITKEEIEYIESN